MDDICLMFSRPEAGWNQASRVLQSVTKGYPSWCRGASSGPKNGRWSERHPNEVCYSLPLYLAEHLYTPGGNSQVFGSTALPKPAMEHSSVAGYCAAMERSSVAIYDLGG